jgi:hypothetical protein
VNEKINTSQKKINIKKILNILLNMYAIVVKGYILNIKFLLYEDHLLKIFPMIKEWKKYLKCIDM